MYTNPLYLKSFGSW